MPNATGVPVYVCWTTYLISCRMCYSLKYVCNHTDMCECDQGKNEWEMKTKEKRINEQ